jgi:hypothetical protein
VRHQQLLLACHLLAAHLHQPQRQPHLLPAPSPVAHCGNALQGDWPLQLLRCCPAPASAAAQVVLLAAPAAVAPPPPAAAAPAPQPLPLPGVSAVGVPCSAAFQMPQPVHLRQLRCTLHMTHRQPSPHALIPEPAFLLLHLAASCSPAAPPLPAAALAPAPTCSAASLHRDSWLPAQLPLHLQGPADPDAAAPAAAAAAAAGGRSAPACWLPALLP